MRQVKVRINQGGFRKMILEIYQNRCCVTGLDLPRLCIASHIIGWADNTKTRMPARLPEPSLGDGQGVVPRAAGASFGQAPRERPGDPRNGLCLSATYDKAFDQHLISFDEDYRLVVAPEIRDHYRNDHAREADEVPELVEGFEKREGQGISLPKKHDHWPLREYLVSHREQLHRIC